MKSTMIRSIEKIVCWTFFLQSKMSHTKVIAVRRKKPIIENGSRIIFLAANETTRVRFVPFLAPQIK